MMEVAVLPKRRSSIKPRRRQVRAPHSPERPATHAPERPATPERPAAPERPATPDRHAAETPDRPASAKARRRDRGGTPQDRAVYSCECGMVFEGHVSTSVGCPHCGRTQAW